MRDRYYVDVADEWEASAIMMDVRMLSADVARNSRVDADRVFELYMRLTGYILNGTIGASGDASRDASSRSAAGTD